MLLKKEDWLNIHAHLASLLFMCNDWVHVKVEGQCHFLSCWLLGHHLEVESPTLFMTTSMTIAKTCLKLLQCVCISGGGLHSVKNWANACLKLGPAWPCFGTKHLCSLVL